MRSKARASADLDRVVGFVYRPGLETGMPGTFSALSGLLGPVQGKEKPSVSPPLSLTPLPSPLGTHSFSLSVDIVPDLPPSPQRSLSAN
jgi:hypothetical protein